MIIYLFIKKVCQGVLFVKEGRRRARQEITETIAVESNGFER
jgi:hypothetical protein